MKEAKVMRVVLNRDKGMGDSNRGSYEMGTASVLVYKDRRPPKIEMIPTDQGTVVYRRTDFDKVWSPSDKKRINFCTERVFTLQDYKKAKQAYDTVINVLMGKWELRDAENAAVMLATAVDSGFAVPFGALKKLLDCGYITLDTFSKYKNRTKGARDSI